MRKNIRKICAGTLSLAMFCSMAALPAKSAFAKVGLNKKTMTLYANGPVTYKKALLYLSDGETEYMPKFYTWDDKVATITEDGVVTAKGVGKTRLVASSNGNNYICELTVKKFTYPSTDSFKVSAAKPSIKVGETMAVHAQISGTVKGFKYQSTDSKILTVSEKGMITAQSAGTAKVKVTTKAKVKNGTAISKYIIIKVTGKKVSVKPTATPSAKPTVKPTTKPSSTPVSTSTSSPESSSTPVPVNTSSPEPSSTAVPTQTQTPNETPASRIHQISGNTITIEGEYSKNSSDYDITYNGKKVAVKDIQYMSEMKGVAITLDVDSLKNGYVAVSVKKETESAYYVVVTEEEKVSKIDVLGNTLQKDVDFDKVTELNGQKQYASGYHMAMIEYQVLNQFGQRMDATVDAYCSYGSIATADGGAVIPCTKTKNGMLKVKVTDLEATSGKVILINSNTGNKVTTDVTLADH